jgi:hypothetical protein
MSSATAAELPVSVSDGEVGDVCGKSCGVLGMLQRYWQETVHDRAAAAN